MTAADTVAVDEDTAVYRAYDDQDRLLYVGVTADVDKRMRQHEYRQWHPLMRRYTVTWYDTRAEALAAETAAILIEDPVFNLAGRDRPWQDRWRLAYPDRRPEDVTEDELRADREAAEARAQEAMRRGRQALRDQHMPTAAELLDELRVERIKTDELQEILRRHGPNGDEDACRAEVGEWRDRWRALGLWYGAA